MNQNVVWLFFGKYFTITDSGVLKIMLLLCLEKAQSIRVSGTFACNLNSSEMIAQL